MPSSAIATNQIEHDRPEGAADLRRALRLQREQREQDRDRDRQHVRLQRWRDLLHALERRKHGNRRRDRAVAIDQRRAEQADGDDRGAMPLLDAEQRHQRDDAALAVVVDAHGEADVFDARDDEQGPEDQRQRAQRSSAASGCGPVIVEHGLQRVERARADVAEHHAQAPRPKAASGAFAIDRGSSFAEGFGISCIFWKEPPTVKIGGFRELTRRNDYIDCWHLCACSIQV